MPVVCPCRMRYLARAELVEAPRSRLQSGRHGHTISFFHLRKFCSDGMERRDSIGKRAPAHPAPGGILTPYSAQSGTPLRLLSFCLVFPTGLPAGSGRETQGLLPPDRPLRHSAAESALPRQSCALNGAAARLHQIRWVRLPAPWLLSGGGHLPFRLAVRCAGKNVPAPPSNVRDGCWRQSLFYILLPRRCCPVFPARARKCNWPERDHAPKRSRLAVWLCFCRRPESPELRGNTRSGRSAPADCLCPRQRLVRIRFSLCAPAQKP